MDPEIKSQRGLDCFELLIMADEWQLRMLYEPDEIAELKAQHDFECAEVKGRA